MGQDRLDHKNYHGALLCFERAYVNRVDIEIVFVEFSSKKVAPSSFSNQFSDGNTLMTYFESFNKRKLVNSMIVKGNLSLSY